MLNRASPAIIIRNDQSTGNSSRPGTDLLALSCVVMVVTLHCLCCMLYEFKRRTISYPDFKNSRKLRGYPKPQKKKKSICEPLIRNTQYYLSVG